MAGYIGTQPVPQATQTRDSFTATSGQVSFSCSGYTPNFLDVFLNGIKLAAADYTATNGSDVVLASGASTGDILEVVAFTTFNSASSSIDDNGNATALTIDSSENVMIGTAVASGFQSSSSATGTIAYSGGAIASNVSGDAPAYFNRLSSDGTIINLRKNGTTVGSIATQGSRLSIGSGDVNLNFNASANSMYPISDPAAGTLSSGIVDLGAALATFKDAYLSGGVYLGGTGSANYLDSYETGTWTVNVTKGGSALPVNTRYAYYTRVGNLIYLSFYWFHNGGLSSQTNNSTQYKVIGLPYALQAGISAAYAGIGSTYLVVNGNNVANDYYHKWQVNATDKLSLTGHAQLTQHSSGVLEFSGSGVFRI